MLTTLVLAVLSAAPPTEVDRDVIKLETCRIAAVSFRNDSDGWMSDHCGKVFRSNDGGRSWRPDAKLTEVFLGHVSQHSVLRVEAWHWFDERVGLAFVYGKPIVFRTEDAGATWTSIRLPSTEYEMVYAVEHAGTHVWFCGSSGRVTRSEDGGRSWVLGEQLFEKAAANPTNWCSAISFLDERNGWISGWKTLHATQDGGKSWSTLKPILRLGSESRMRAEEVRGLIRLTPKRAWARTNDDSLYFTADGGATWEKKTVSISQPTVALRRDGRNVLLRAPASALEAGVPIADDDWSARGTRGVVNTALNVYQGGALVRGGPPTSSGTRNMVQLAATRRFDRTMWGWAGDLVFRSDDEGLSWYRIGRVPAQVDRLEPSNGHDLFARSNVRLFASLDGGATWSETTELAHRTDWVRLTGEDLGLREWDSIHCAATVPSTVEIDFGTQGCFGGTQQKLRLELSTDAGRISGEWSQWDPVARKSVEHRVDRRTSADEVRNIIRSIADAATQPEPTSDCQSTDTKFVRLRWTCGRAPRSTMSFKSNDCMDPDELPEALHPARAAAGAPRASRATSVSRTAMDALKK